MSHQLKLSQINGRARSLIPAALLILQPLISALALIPQPAHADVASGDIIFYQEQTPGQLQPGTSNDYPVTITKRASDGTLTNLSTGSTGVWPTDVQPDVSPDGSRVAMVGWRPAADDPSYDPVLPRLIIMNSDGSGQTFLHQPLKDNVDPDNPTVGASLVDFSPRWSPDGQQIAYSRIINSSVQYTVNIYKINSDGTSDKPLTTSGLADSPAWSPNGSKIAYDQYDPSTGGSQLYIMNADGTSPHLISASNSGYADYAPTWAPDGSRIYFASSQGGIQYYSSSDGFATTNVTRSSSPVTTFTPHGGESFYNGDIYRFGISADGNTLTFSSYSSTDPVGCDQLYTVSSGGGTPTKLTDTGCSYGNYGPMFVDNAWPTASTKTMVALGDSVAAGEGINYGWTWDNTNQKWVNGASSPTWQDTTNAMGANYQQCHQSGRSYADEFRLNGDNYHVYNMACTGATATQELDSNSNPTNHGGILDSELFDGGSNPYPNDVLGSSLNTNLTVSPQLGGSCSECESANAYFDGLNSSHHDGHTPDVVTLTLGANDVHFSHWITKCYDPLEVVGCDSQDNTNQLNQQLSSEYADLGLVLAELNNRAATVLDKTLRVLVTNYYDPFPANTTSCVDTDGQGSYVSMSTQEKVWLENGLSQLNANIADRVSYAKQHYSHLNISLVDLSTVMAGHEWCSQDPWAYGASLNFPIVNGSIVPSNNPAPFHPTPDGQRAIYEKVRAALLQPSNLAASTQSGNVLGLTWTASDGAVSYNVYRDNVKIGTIQATSYNDSTASAGIHTYQVSGVDKFGNESDLTDPITVQVGEANCTATLPATKDPAGSQTTDSTYNKELGVKFTVASSTTASAVKFYRAVADSVGYQVHLWDDSGNLLASGFSGAGSITGTGWITVPLTQTVSLSPGTTYTASYHAAHGRYQEIPYGYANSYTSSTLTVPADGGVFKEYQNNTSPQFPTQTYNSFSYMVTPVLADTTSDAVPQLAPGATDGNTDAVEVGVKFTPAFDVSGTAVKFYRGVASSSGYKVHLWDLSGNLLSSGEDTSATGTGWITINLDTPVNLTAGQTYTASYYGHQPQYIHNYYTSAQSDTMLATPTSAGVYVYPSGTDPQFPSSSYQNNSYLVTPVVTYSDTTAPAAPGNVTTSVAADTVTVNWSQALDTQGSNTTPAKQYTVFRGSTQLGTVDSGTTSYVDPGLDPGSYSYTVKAVDYCGNVSAASSGTQATLNYETLGGDTTNALASNDFGAITVGVRFQSAVAGTVPGVQFYRPTDSGFGTSVGLWDASGNLLGSGVADAGANLGPGWVKVMFTTPVSVAAGTTYTAGYFTSAGNYAYTHYAYDSAVTVGDITALADSNGGNGVYQYGGSLAFPSSSYLASNYWVSPIFEP